MRRAADGPPRAVALAPLVAMLVDVALGEPPARFHPTVAMGSLIAAARRRRPPHDSAAAAFALGAATVVAGTFTAYVSGRLAERALARAPRVARATLAGLALKPALSLRALLAAGCEVERALRVDDVATARRLLAWHLVSRDTRDLTPSEVAGAAIESIAENFNDAVVAPLLAFRAGGLGLAYAHRFVNTADAMLGYRTRELEWFGKAAARTDDLLGLAPARLSALLLALAAPAGSGCTRAALRTVARDARRTASPNAGWPMAAVAGALGVQLTKRGAYSLNVRARAPGWRDLARARRIVGGAAGLAVGLACA